MPLFRTSCTYVPPPLWPIAHFDPNSCCFFLLFRLLPMPLYCHVRKRATPVPLWGTSCAPSMGMTTPHRLAAVHGKCSVSPLKFVSTEVAVFVVVFVVHVNSLFRVACVICVRLTFVYSLFGQLSPSCTISTIFFSVFFSTTLCPRHSKYRASRLTNFIPSILSAGSWQVC